MNCPVCNNKLISDGYTTIFRAININKETAMNCPVCGGTMIGDGYTTPIHCENVDLDPWIEPDFGPIYCIEESPEMSDEEYALEEYCRIAELKLDRDYENNMPLENNGTGKVYGWEDDIPF